MTMARIIIPAEQMTILLNSLWSGAGPVIPGTHVTPEVSEARRALFNRLSMYQGGVTVAGEIHVAGVDEDHVQIRNDSPVEDDLRTMTRVAARVVGDHRSLAEVDVQARPSGDDRDRAAVVLERSLDDLADALSVVIDHQERR